MLGYKTRRGKFQRVKFTQGMLSDDNDNPTITVKIPWWYLMITGRYL